MYEWLELRKKWEHDQVTVEQLLGQLVLHGEQNHSQVVAMQRRMEMLDQTIAALTLRLNAVEGAPTKRYVVYSSHLQLSVG